MDRYKVKLVKKYVFDLDGKNKSDIREQVDYIMTQSKILEMPYVDKTIKINIKKNKRGKNNETNN